MSAIPAPLIGAAREHGRALPVALAAGRVEARKLLRHPASIVGAVLALAIPVVATWNDMPVLNRYDALTNESLIPFGVGVLVAAHLGTMRARRHRTTELFDSLAATDATMTAAHLIAVGFAAGFALLLVAGELAFMLAIGGVTAPRPEVVMIGPALVAFAGAFGVALGRWAPRLFAAPLGLTGIVAACTVLMASNSADGKAWLSLWVVSDALNGTVSELSLRPYGWRLLYITGLAVVAAAIAFTRHRRQRIAALGLALTAMTGTAFAGYQEMKLVPRSERRVLAAQAVEGYGDRSCREHASIRYCTFRGYEDWIDRWREPIEGALAATPTEARPDDLRIIQSPSDNENWDQRANIILVRHFRRERRKAELASGTVINPSLHWGRNSAEGRSELALALLTAAHATGIDTHFRLTEADVAQFDHPRRHGLRVGRLQQQCYSLEQGRAIVALWLAAQATDGTRAAFTGAAAEIPYIVDPDDAKADDYFSPEQWTLSEYTAESAGVWEVGWGTRETTYANSLLVRDDAEVRATIAANWDRLVDPATTSDEAAALLGLTPLPPLKDAIENWGYFRRYRGLQQLGVSCH